MHNKRKCSNDKIERIKAHSNDLGSNKINDEQATGQLSCTRKYQLCDSFEHSLKG